MSFSPEAVADAAYEEGLMPSSCLALYKRLVALQRRCDAHRLTVDELDGPTLATLLYLSRDKWKVSTMLITTWAVDWWCRVDGRTELGKTNPVSELMRVLRSNPTSRPRRADGYGDMLPEVLDAIGLIPGPANVTREARAIAAICLSISLRLPVTDVAVTPATAVDYHRLDDQISVYSAVSQRRIKILPGTLGYDGLVLTHQSCASVTRTYFLAVTVDDKGKPVALKNQSASSVRDKIVGQLSAAAAARARLCWDPDATLSIDTAEKLVRSVQIASARRARDRAYVLLQVAWALRGIEVEDLICTEAWPVGDAWIISIVRKGGTRQDLMVGHSAVCSSTCPACALAEWVTLRPEVGGALFCSLPAADPAPNWSITPMHERLKRIAQLLGTDIRLRRHSGRVDFFNRVAGVLPTNEACRLAGLQCKDTAIKYLRSYNPFDDQPQLPV